MLRHRILDTRYSIRFGQWILLVAVLLAAFLWLWRGSGLFPGTDRTWQAMQDRGTWRVGMDPAFPPFEMLDASGTPVGYDVDLARRMAQSWGLEVEIVTTGFDGLLDALQAGKIDSIVSALPMDPRLTKDIAYSPAYFDAGVFLVVRTDGGSPPLTGPADLPGQTVAVEWGGAGDAVGRRLQRQLPPAPSSSESSPEASPGEIILLPFETQDDALAALLSGEADAALVDGVTLGLAQGSGDALQAVGTALDSNPYVIAAPIDAHILTQQIADTLARFQADGVLNQLKEEWFSP